MIQYVVTRAIGGEKQYLRMGYNGLGLGGRDEFESVQTLAEATRFGRIGAALWAQRMNAMVEPFGSKPAEYGVEEVER